MKSWILFGTMLALNLSLLNVTQAEEATMKTDRPTVTIETTQGTFEVTLFPDVAPKAVENFLKHAQDHYYDGTIFHRVIPGFMIQGGDPAGNGTGGQSIWGKSFEDEFSPSVKFDKPGLLAMANRGPKTNGSQFFITTAPTSWLNQKHTIFGEVTKGYNIVEKIESTKTGPQDKPLEPQKILKISLKK
jgi:peptidylprolyl isomerase